MTGSSTENDFWAAYRVSDPVLDAGILKGIEQVDWPSLNQAYGAASDIPALLRAVLSANPEHRERAFDDLFSEIVHQGNLYQATSYVVPFLIRMLSDARTPDRTNIVYLLWEIARGYPTFSVSHEWFRNYYEQQGIDFDALVARGTEYARLAHEAVHSGLDLYPALLNDPEPSTRGGAVRLLCEYPQDASQILPALYEHIARETDEETQSSTLNERIVAYLLRVTESGGEVRGRFINLLEAIASDEHKSRVIRFPAACASAKLAPHQLAERALNTLLDAAAHPEGIDPYTRYLPDPEILSPDQHLEVCEASTVRDAVEAMSLLEPSRAVPALIQALAQAKTPEHAHTIGTMLLSLALLGERPEFRSTTLDRAVYKDNVVDYAKTHHLQSVDGVEHRTYPILVSAIQPGSLSDLQKAAVKAVQQSEKIQEIKSNLLNAFGISDLAVD